MQPSDVILFPLMTIALYLTIQLLRAAGAMVRTALHEADEAKSCAIHNGILHQSVDPHY